LRSAPDAGLRGRRLDAEKASRKGERAPAICVCALDEHVRPAGDELVDAVVGTRRAIGPSYN
jgi:hypothetical protein